MTDRISLPLLIAVVGFFLGFVLVSPLGCTVSESTQANSRDGVTTITSAGTSCSNLLGIDYVGGRDYDPPQLPAVGAGFLLALVSGLLTYLHLRSRQKEIRASTLGWIGVGIHLAWTLFLSGLGLFSDGSLDENWRTALVFILLAALPALVAICGLVRWPALLLAAGIVCLPLSFISLAGATLPLLLPAALYLLAYSRSNRPSFPSGFR